GSYVVTACDTGLSTWAPEGKRIKEFDAKNPVVYCKHRPDSGEIFFVGDASGFLDPKSGKVRHLTHQDMVGGSLARDGKRAVTMNAAGSVFLCDAAKGAPLRTLAGHSKPVLSAAWSPDGRT